MGVVSKIIELTHQNDDVRGQSRNIVILDHRRVGNVADCSCDCESVRKVSECGNRVRRNVPNLSFGRELVDLMNQERLGQVRMRFERSVSELAKGPQAPGYTQSTADEGIALSDCYFILCRNVSSLDQAEIRVAR